MARPSTLKREHGSDGRAAAADAYDADVRSVRFAVPAMGTLRGVSTVAEPRACFRVVRLCDRKETQWGSEIGSRTPQLRVRS